MLNPERDFRAEMRELIGQLQESLSRTILSTDDRPALMPNAAEALADFREPLPDGGCGAAAAIDELMRLNGIAGANTAGPRAYHFVIGGSTPAAYAADVLAATYDAITYTWVVSPVGVSMELQAIDWLKELFGLPASWPGIIVTGGTMANFVGLAAARQWWGTQHGVDVSEVGLAGLPQMPVLTSGFVHASTLKVLALQGIGRAGVRRFERDEYGRLDIEAMARALEELDGSPTIVVVNAGEVNAGEFDPVEEMISLARQHNCWVHVDGAFGLFAAVSPQTEHFVRGVEKADSVAVDGHKLLNVPYDSGYAFVRDYKLMAQAFRYSADYLPEEDAARPTLGAIGPESSRRARSFAVWATLKAYGRNGHRAIVEHCVDIARHFGEVVQETPELELMNDPQFNIVSFRYNPGGLSDKELDRLNQQLGDAVIADGRFLVGTSRLGARTVFRPAFANWRTRKDDVEALASTVVELGRSL